MMGALLRAGPGERRLLPEGRAGPMPWVIAVMAFLAALALAAALTLDGAARGLGEGLSSRVTVQVVTADAGEARAQADAAARALRGLPGVVAVRTVPLAEVEALLAPWLGGGAAAALPLPPMIDVELGETVDRRVVVQTLARAAPAARVDRHDAALAAFAGLVSTLRLLATALVLLMAAAMAAVIALAARAALDTHRGTVDILHLLGAEDGQIARLYARRLALDALTGAAAGGALAAPVLWGLGRAVDRASFGLEAPAASGYAALVLLPLAVAALATAAARVAILRALKRTT